MRAEAVKPVRPRKQDVACVGGRERHRPAKVKAEAGHVYPGDDGRQLQAAGGLGRRDDRRLLQVTIGQLLVHRAGFNGKEDTEPLGAYLRANTGQRTAFDTQLKWLLPVRLSSTPGTRGSPSLPAPAVGGLRCAG